MRKTLNINLGGMAFIIDENAFELLHNYLEALRKKFNNEAEREEIINDIESRMAEMLGQKLANRKEVISIEEIQEIMEAMGKPEDIAGEETGSAATGAATTGPATSATTSSTAMGPPVARKLFRDPDDAKIGGVISGLCHYFGINDPVWVRIAAIILIFMTGGGVILFYILLLIVIPKANTAAEKLQMKGEPVNINTIEREIKDAASRAGESVHRFVKEQNFFEKLADILVSVFSVVLKMVALGVMVIGMIALIGVLIGFACFYLLGTTSLTRESLLLVDTPHTISLFSFGFLLFCAIPFIAVVYAALKALTGNRSRVPWLKWTLLTGWLVGLVLLLVSAFNIFDNFKTDAVTKKQLSLVQPANGTIYVQLADSAGNKINGMETDFNFNIDQNGMFVNGNDVSELGKIPVGKPKLELTTSDNDTFYLQEIISARGKNKRNAQNNADMVIYSYLQSDTVVDLTPLLYIPQNGKWRLQRMTLRLAIPAAKKIRFADNIDWWAATVKDDDSYDDTKFANTLWTVEDGKVKCIEGENHSSMQRHKTDVTEKPGKKTKKVKKENDEDKDDKSDQDF